MPDDFELILRKNQENLACKTWVCSDEMEQYLQEIRAMRGGRRLR